MVGEPAAALERLVDALSEPVGRTARSRAAEAVRMRIAPAPGRCPPCFVASTQMAPKSKARLAREHLERAQPAVTAGSYTEAVTWLFVSLEAAIAAVAERHGLKTEPKHWQKLEIAERLRGEGVLEDDVAATLRALNEARKEALYEGEEPDLGGKSLEDLATVVETTVELAEGTNDV